MRKMLLLKVRKKIAPIGLLLLYVLLQPIALYANPIEGYVLSGVVVSMSDSAPVIGATVMVVGSQRGTVTDIDGYYQIKVQKGETLKYSYIGYKSQEVLVAAQSSINISLEEDMSSIDEVVVIGYGVQKKKLITGATSQVTGDNIQQMNTTNPLQAMQGIASGVTISSTSGQPGSEMNVQIRGLGTIGNSDPLYIIDGVGGDITTLNPADIESIDVLKDAASAAIYGAQAANGVVLVTTKKGSEGKAQVTFDAYYGVQNVYRTTDMLNASEYKVIMDEQALNSGESAYNWGSMASIQGVDTDWVGSMFMNNAMTDSYTIGISGGSKTSNYAISLGKMEQEGVVGGADVSNYKRYNFRVNSEHKLFNGFLTVGEQISYAGVSTVGVSVGNQYNNTLRSAFDASPLSPIYSDNNIYDSPYNDTSNSDWYNADGNPYGNMMTNTNNKNKSHTFSGNLYLEIEPIERLKIRSLVGAVYNSSNYRSYTPMYQFSIYSYNNTRNAVTQNTSNGTTITWSNTATYNFSIAEHKFDALIGMEMSSYDGEYLGVTGGELKEGFDNWEDAYIDNTLSSSSDNGLSVSGRPHDSSRNFSTFSRIGWSYLDKYMLNATIRADGSSRFAKGNRVGYFPSVSAGWVLSSESFAEGASHWINFMKLRASWGQVGNQNIDNFQYVAPINSSNTHYIFGTNLGSTAQLPYWGAYPSRLANESLSWETSEQFNVGLDARLFDKLSINADFYIKTTKDWLVEAPILATVGTGAPIINGGNVKNTGVELSLDWRDQIGRGGFTYNIGLNGAYNKNIVGQIPTEDGIIHGQTNMLYNNSPEFYRSQNGHTMGYFWGYKTDGIFQNQNEIDEWIAAGNGVLQSNVQPGDVKYVDVKKDGVIDDDDKVDLGNGMPDFTLGVNLGFTYKNFDFSTFLNGSFGQQVVQSYRNQTSKYANYTSDILNRWTGEGTSNKMPRVTNSNINWQFSDLYVHDADFLRISNVTLGYDFARLINNMNIISQLRLYAQVQNLFTFTNYNGMDPEVGYDLDGGGGAGVSGIDLGYYPRPTVFLLGVNVKF